MSYVSTLELPFEGSATCTVCDFATPEMLISSWTSIEVEVPENVFARAPSNNTVLDGVKFLPVNRIKPCGTPTIVLEGNIWERTGAEELEVGVTVRFRVAPWLRVPDVPVTITFPWDAAEPIAAV